MAAHHGPAVEAAAGGRRARRHAAARHVDHPTAPAGVTALLVRERGMVSRRQG
ncbi:hypothetical protein LZ683_23215 [Comamonas testosteroni]|uniref:hypothetical protein n=1 Tax=Comamonas testosteroni TaxID=285 RepID=UPI0023AAADD4|nr:hypothetical protein [Comamonas testosteroni]WEE77018.1 hypothetical protein LZ683_23215 [Comamonas testosteroni]